MLPSLLHRTCTCARHDYIHIPGRAKNWCAAGAIHLDLNTLAASLLARPWASMPRVPTMASPSTHACVYAAVAPPFVLPFAAGLNDQRVSPSSHPTNPRVTVHLPSFHAIHVSEQVQWWLCLAKEVALTVHGIHEMTSV